MLLLWMLFTDLPTERNLERSESSDTRTLLTLPKELRLMIFEQVLRTDNSDIHSLFYRDRAIGPLSPALMRICRQIRDEVGKLYFRSKTVWFHTFGELGAARMFAPGTVPYWRNVHVEWTGRRVRTPSGKEWFLELGLEMLANMTGLRHISLDVDCIVLDEDACLRQVGWQAWAGLRAGLRAGVPSDRFDHANSLSRIMSQALEWNISRIASQIKLALPLEQSLRSFEIAGEVVKRDKFGKKRAAGQFRRVFEARKGRWEMLMVSVSGSL
ncbi:hypothetical protein LTR37_013930 [Vermiconidia calcicola]|uniref:Uncharacterized protein n=1 Tax=Vermiconidia calcicola TaxID=1690605 RepID=A0ACC3MV67_9PEZI|nr:hypothetical protein LTR37_013930 [Vermiconidia calcicola]